MLKQFTSLRVNFSVVFLGAFVILGLTRFTSLLPTKYYFSFSKLMAAEKEPFLVESPTISGGKLCDLLQRYKIDKREFHFQVNCAWDIEETREQNVIEPAKLRPEIIDNIYRTVLNNDQIVRKKIDKVIKKYEISAMSDADIKNMTDNDSSSSSVYLSLIQNYSDQIKSDIEKAIAEFSRESLENVFNPESENEAPQDTTLSEEATPKDGAVSEEASENEDEDYKLKLDPEEVNRVLDANHSFSKDINANLKMISVPKVTKVTIDNILEKGGFPGLKMVVDFPMHRQLGRS